MSHMTILIVLGAMVFIPALVCLLTDSAPSDAFKGGR